MPELSAVLSWLTANETYICAPIYMHGGSKLASLGHPVVVGVKYHHLSIYRCLSATPSHRDARCDATPTGCEEMLFTFASASSDSNAPENVHFDIPRHMLLQLHVELATDTRKATETRNATVYIPLRRPLGPMVRFIEIGPRRDWGGAQRRITGSCECANQLPSFAQYLILHAHHRAISVCVHIASGYEMCAPRDVPLNAIVRFRHENVSRLHLACYFSSPSRLGVHSVDEMCFAYVLMNAPSWPYHCWTSPREQTCRFRDR